MTCQKKTGYTWGKSRRWWWWWRTLNLLIYCLIWSQTHEIITQALQQVHKLHLSEMLNSCLSTYWTSESNSFDWIIKCLAALLIRYTSHQRDVCVFNWINSNYHIMPETREEAEQWNFSNYYLHDCVHNIIIN